MESVRVNKSATLMIALALSPGVLFSILLQDADYLMASFYSLCSILPFGNAHRSKQVTYFFAAVIMLYSLLIYYFMNQWVIVYVLLATPMCLFSIYEKRNKSLKSMSNWWLIEIVYAGFKIQHAPTIIVTAKYILIFLLTISGCAFALYSQKELPFKLPSFKVEKEHVRYYVKYPLALLITVAILALFHL